MPNDDVKPTTQELADADQFLWDEFALTNQDELAMYVASQQKQLTALRSELEKVKQEFVEYVTGSKDLKFPETTRFQWAANLGRQQVLEEQLTALQALCEWQREALMEHHHHDIQKCLVYFVPDEVPVNQMRWPTDLGEAYSESSLCDKTLQTLSLTPQSALDALQAERGLSEDRRLMLDAVKNATYFFLSEEEWIKLRELAKKP